jgi:hypothetical protein
MVLGIFIVRQKNSQTNEKRINYASFNNKTQEKQAFFPISPAYLLLPKKVFSFRKSLFQYKKTLSARLTSVAGSSHECKTLLPYWQGKFRIFLIFRQINKQYNKQ